MTRQEMVDYLHELAYREREYLSVVLDGIEGPCAIAMKLEEAAGMLKEQEPVKPVIAGKGILERTRCGACGSEIANSYVFCWYCGKKVKWDG